MDISKALAGFTVFAILTLVFSNIVQAQVYHWVDEDGVFHFSDRPNAGAKKVQLIEVNQQTDNADGQKNIQRNRAWFKQRSEQRYKSELAAAKARKKQNKAAAKQAEHCRKLKTKLANMRDKFSAQKRRGISYKSAQKQELAIELQRNKIKRQCP